MAPRRPRRLAVTTTLAAVAAIAATASGGLPGARGQPAPPPAPAASRPPVPVADHAAYLVSVYVLDPAAAEPADGDGDGACPPTAAITSLDGWADGTPLVEGPPGLYSSTATLPVRAVRFGAALCGTAASGGGGGGGGGAPLTVSWSVTPARGWRSYRLATAAGGAAGAGAAADGAPEVVTRCVGGGGAAYAFRSIFFDVDEEGERLEVEGVASRCAYVKAVGGGGGEVSPPPMPPVGAPPTNGTIGGGGGGEGGGVEPTPAASSPTPSPALSPMPSPTSSPETGEEAVEGTPAPSDDEPACFPAAATVELADGSTTELAALSAGMAVRVAQGAHTGAHSHVYGWSHRQLDGRHTYVRLSHVPETAAGDERPAPRHLLLSPGHLLYVGGSLVPAWSVRVGDALATPGVAGGVSRVVATGTTTAVGKVNPHTLSGDLLVDGVRVSTYTDALPPAVAHALLTPARAAFRAGLSVEPMGRLLYGGVPGWRRWWAQEHGQGRGGGCQW